MAGKELLLLAPLLPQIIKILSQYVPELVQLVQSAVEQINSLDDSSRELRQKLQKFKYLLKEMAGDVRNWIKEIGDFLSYADVQDDESVRVEVLAGPENSAYVAQFHCYVDRLSGSYKNIEDSMEKAKAACQSAVTSCEEKRREAKKNKKTAQIVGGVATASVLVGGGVGISLVAGLFTFGIGTVVGLGITAVVASGGITGTAVVAGAAGTATHLVASKFKEIEDKCKDLCNKFEAHSNQTSKMHLILHKYFGEVTYIKDKMEDCAKGCDHTLLVRGVKECHATFKSDRKKLDDLLEKIRDT